MAAFTKRKSIIADETEELRRMLTDTPTMLAWVLNNGDLATERGMTRWPKVPYTIADIKSGEKMIFIYSGSILESYPLQISGLYGAFIIPDQ